MAVTNINIDSQILTFADFASFPPSGTVKTIYIAEDTNFQYYWNGTAYELLTTDILIPANLTFYATTAASPIMGYQKLVISIDDPDYDEPAVDVSTGAITGTGQLIAELASDAGIFAGNPGQINITTIGEIRRTSGSGVAQFYYEVYQRDSGGTETLIATSNTTNSISNTVYQQFQASALFNNGTWLNTDRVVIKYYGSKIGGGSNPTYDFLFGGANPVRTLFPISAQLLLNVPISIGVTGVTGGTNDFVLKVDSGLKLAQSQLKTVGGNSLFGSGDIAVGGGITIGTSAITSGTVNRVLFQGAGNLVQQDAGFVWNNTDKRLILGADQSSVDTNPRLVVVGKNPSGTTTLAAFHNSTGNSNALVIRDDGLVGIGTSSIANTRLGIRGSSTLTTDFALTITNSTPANILQVNNAGQTTISNRGNASLPTILNLDGFTTVAGTNFHNNRIEWRNSASTVFGRAFSFDGTIKGLWLDAGGNTSALLLRQNGGGGIIGNYSGDLSADAALNTVSSGASFTVLNTSPTLFAAIRIFAPLNGLNTEICSTQFWALNSASNAKRYARIFLRITSTTNNSESGDLGFNTISSGTEADRMVLKSNGNLLLGTTTDIASSIMTLASTTKGFLPPRNANPAANIAAPAEGLICFDTTDKKLQVYDGTNWIDLH